MARFCLLLLSLVCITCLNICNAQSEDPFKPQLKTYTPVSPNTASLGKFGEYPVDFSSGLVDISIPIYEIKSSRLTLPISIKYHASGIKVGDQASCVGLGWALQAGGMLSRNVRDKVDEYNGYLKSYNTIKSTTVLNPDVVMDDFNYLKSFSQTGFYPVNDAEPDVFSYSLLNKSGQFFFGKDKISTITIPYDKVNISYGTNLSDFTIVDTDGTLYKYGKALDGTIALETVNMPDGAAGTVPDAKTGWMLMEIVSADKSDTIHFKYSYDLVEYDYGITDNAEIWDKHAGTPENQKFQFQRLGLRSMSTGSSHFKGMQQTLDEILFKNGKVTFVKDQTKDIDGISRKINKIEVSRLDQATGFYSVIKSVSFSYDYFPTYKRLRLNQLAFNDNSNTAVQTYSFQYNTTAVPSWSTRAIDSWGFYNGKAGNTTLLQNAYINDGAANDLGALIADVGTSDRTPDEYFAQACILNSVTYPTGGRTDFIYELNKYREPNVTPDKFAGGLRIKQINSYDGINPLPNIKSYTYDEGETGTGKLVTPIDYWGYYATQYDLLYIGGSFDPEYPTESVRVRNYSSNPVTGLTGLDGRIVYYQFVTEYDGTPTANNGKTTYRFDYTGDTYIYYTPTKGKYYRQNYSWKRGHLLEKTVYTNAGKPVHKTVNRYNQVYQQWYGEAGYVINEKFHLTDNSSHTPSLECNSPNQAGCTYRQYKGMYSYNTFSIETGNYKLTGTDDYTYDQRDVTKFKKVQVDYQYDPNIYEPSKITKRESNTYEVTNFSYPLNYNTSVTTTDPFINGIKFLTSNNTLTQVIETYKQKYKNDNTYLGVTDAILTQFKTDAPLPLAIYKLKRTGPLTSFTPSSISGTTFVKNANYEPYLQINAYDNTNPVEQQKTQDVLHAYIWDYKQAWPVAEVINSNKNDIAYTSFESDGTSAVGQWSGITAANIVNDNTYKGVTGIKRYTITGSILSKDNLNAGKTYVVSYWNNAAAPYTVSGTLAPGAKNPYKITVNGLTWYYWEHRVSNITKVLVTGTGSIDELRLYPVDAQMITYTYNPLIGLSTKSDVNGRISFYEYDKFNRLMLIRDMNGYIIKTLDYKYKSPTF